MNRADIRAHGVRLELGHAMKQRNGTLPETEMPRLKYWTVAPDAVKLMMSLNAYLEKSSIEASMRHLVKLRVSQINGCAYCVDLHSHEALRDGEKSQQLHWRETELFTPRERAALAYAESITRVSDTHVPDEDYYLVEQHFNELELVDLTLTISTMNA
jgi:AhpD family alkylhydroperoxidase